MANSNNWGEIYKSTWWGDEDWSANSLKIDSAPPGFAFTGLLDTYTGAAAAYSVRKLSSTYTGDALRVRRSSDDTEQDIGFNASNELDTAALLSFVGTGGSDNGFVSKWYDQSGNTKDVIQADASEQPKIVSAGNVITDGGKPSITVDQTTTNGLTIPIAASSTQDFFQVHKSNDDRFILLKDSTSGARYAYAAIDGNTSTDLHGSYGSPSLYVNGSAESPANRDALHTLLCTDTQVLMSSVGGDSSAWTGNIIWGNYSSFNVYDGNVQEIIFFNSDQSSNRTGIESNINNYFSIYEP